MYLLFSSPLCFPLYINIDNVNTMKPHLMCNDTITYVRFLEIRSDGNMVITFENYRKPSKHKLRIAHICTQVMEESLLIWGEGGSIKFLSTST